MITEESNPARYDTGFGGLVLTRIAPMDKCAQIDWKLLETYVTPVDAFLIRVQPLDFQERPPFYSKFPNILVWVPAQARSFKIENIFNGIDYAITVSAIRNGVEVARSRTRLFRAGPVPGTVVAYLHPQDFTFSSSGRFTCSPSLLRLPDGRLLVSHDIYERRGGQNITHIYVSDDNGASWSFLSELTPCFWGTLFLHRGVLYILCTSTEYGNLQIYRSDDFGKTFRGPFIILKGEGRWDRPGPHKAPVPIIHYKGRIWTAIEYGCWKQGYHDTGVISIDENADLCNPDNWILSPFVSYDPKWPGVIQGGNPSVLEGNLVVTPEGGLVNILRYETVGGDPEYGKAILMRVDDEHPDAPQSFESCIDFPGNLSKFSIRRDEQTGIYLALVNQPHKPWYKARNILSLAISKDLINWKIAKDLINYEDKDWPEGALHVGFQYPDFFIEGDSLYFVSRTALNGAHNYHDANYITFHRVESFRELLNEAMK